MFRKHLLASTYFKGPLMEAMYTQRVMPKNSTTSNWLATIGPNTRLYDNVNLICNVFLCVCGVDSMGLKSSPTSVFLPSQLKRQEC